MNGGMDTNEMSISELIRVLERFMATEGDIPVVWQSLTHTWPPDVGVNMTQSGRKVLVLNC